MVLWYTGVNASRCTSVLPCHCVTPDRLYVCGEGGGGGGGCNGGNCDTGVRASISKPTPFIYLVFEKTDPFIYLVVRNVDLFICCPLIFYTTFWLVVRQMTNIAVNSLNTKRTNSLEKSVREKYTHIPGCQKSGVFHIRIKKNRASHILFVEKGA